MSNLSEVITKYQHDLIQTYPMLSTLRAGVGPDGMPNKNFLTYLTLNMNLTIQFLRDSGLIKSGIICENCNIGMTIHQSRCTDRIVWCCNKRRRNKVGDRLISEKCNKKRSIRHGSWFSKSKMSLPEILWLTYDTVHGAMQKDIRREYGFSSITTADWTCYYREALVRYVENLHIKIGGTGKTVEIDLIKFEKGKQKNTSLQSDPWVLGGVERGALRCFLLPVESKDSETVLRIINNLVLPGSVIVTDSWKGYRALGSSDSDFTHILTTENGNNLSTIKFVWNSISEGLPEYGLKKKFLTGYLAEYIFKEECRATGRDPFVKFLEIVRETEWQ